MTSHSSGQAELPIFHAAGQPKMKLGVEYEAVDRDGPNRQATLKHNRHAEQDRLDDEDLPLAQLPFPTQYNLREVRMNNWP